jgi:diguanylate cyclase (GGDEF)-like protein
MIMLPAVSSTQQPDPALLRKLIRIELIYLAAVTLIALFDLCVRFLPGLGHALAGHWPPVNPQTALAALLSAVSLTLTLPRFSGWVVRVGQLSAFIVGLLAVTALLGYLHPASAGMGHLPAAHPGFSGSDKMPLHTAAAFTMLALVMIMMRESKGALSHLVDACVSGFCLLVLIVVTGNLYGSLHLFGSAWGDATPPLTLLTLVLLAFVAFTRRAEYGWFMMFLGAGTGGRIARLAAPIVLLVAFLPEPARIQASRSGLIPAEYASALVTSLVVMLGFAVLLMLVWRMNTLEKKVRDLSLRDEQTGLYNRRGFYLMAWQALRQARRSGLPFSVLFVDVDNIPQINASHGFRAGAEALSEMADLLKATFRDTDVVGRIGGDEFAVGGHFSDKIVGMLSLRLKEATNYRNADPGRSYSLSFSLGHVTADDPQRESLEELLARANKALDDDRSDLNFLGD